MKSRQFFSNPRYIGDYSHGHLKNPMLRKKYFRLSPRILSNFKVKNKILCVPILKSNSTESKLQLRKTLGYLTNASQFLVDISTQAEKTFKWTERVFNIFDKNYSNLLFRLVLTTLNSVDPKLFNVFNQHLFDDEPERIHGPAITKMILNDSGNLFQFEDSPRIEKSSECSIRFESIEK
ncbi:uncharacterized protein LOC123673598 [Harmonia axyridis]|uniref:uncharacterized protein LOC123673598 n=1 Tax=Harmonia axyridis TaxID=115357 RepID=UPI001E277C90|nr:uncharacterized protein LOC123673598 [Harmonia axyridis]